MNIDFLTQIINQQKEALKKKKNFFSFYGLKLKCRKPLLRRSFKNSLKSPGEISLIAEIKKASPSRGVIVKDFKPLEIARIYKDCGAAALSVLTEEKYFLGNLSFLNLVRHSVNLPVLRKDFIIDEFQIYESYIAGADAILLIAELLNSEKLIQFLNLAKKLNLDCLVEVSDEKEMLKVLDSPAEIIGINNRNLHNFITDLNVTKTLMPFIPKDTVSVSESGIKTKEDILFLKDLGVNAVLIGETLLESVDISSKVKELFS